MRFRLSALLLVGLAGCTGAPEGGCPAGAVWVRTAVNTVACVPTMRWADSVARANARVQP